MAASTPCRHWHCVGRAALHQLNYCICLQRARARVLSPSHFLIRRGAASGALGCIRHAQVLENSFLALTSLRRNDDASTWFVYKQRESC